MGKRRRYAHIFWRDGEEEVGGGDEVVKSSGEDNLNINAEKRTAG